MALDPQIRQLMTETVSWERHTGDDKHGDASYAAPVELACHVEPAAQSGDEALRRPDGTTVVPSVSMVFDAADANVLLFTHRDRFTVPGIAGGQALEPARVQPIYGGDGSAWLVEVTV